MGLAEKINGDAGGRKSDPKDGRASCAWKSKNESTAFMNVWSGRPASAGH
jgi:hypothetical protein